MTNDLFHIDIKQQKQLFQTLNFKSNLDKKIIIKLDTLINTNFFIKENYEKFTAKTNIEQIENTIINKAKVILRNCKDYTWNNIWNNFKKFIFEQKFFGDYYTCNIIFKWVLVLIYLTDSEKNNFKYFFLVHKKCHKLFSNIDLISSVVDDKTKVINFSYEINFDLDNINTLMKKITNFYQQLDYFFIENLTTLWNELNFSTSKIRKTIQKKQYFFIKENLSKLLTTNKFTNKLTTINNLNLPLNYIFIKYLIDDTNFLFLKEKEITDFLKIITKNLNIKNIDLLKQRINFFLNEHYQKNNEIYMLKFFVWNDDNFEEKIINNLKNMIEDNYITF